jgi:hypothetical protein
MGLAVSGRSIGALAQDQEPGVAGREARGRGGMAVTDYTKIYVDAGQPATLNDGAVQTDCRTLQEAVSAWLALPSAQKIRATVKVINSLNRCGAKGRIARRVLNVAVPEIRLDRARVVSIIGELVAARRSMRACALTPRSGREAAADY